MKVRNVYLLLAYLSWLYGFVLMFSDFTAGIVIEVTVPLLCVVFVYLSDIYGQNREITAKLDDLIKDVKKKKR